MNKELLLIDAHAHIQECYDINDYFSSVFENFSNVIKPEKYSNNWIGVLFFTEVKELNYFDKLKSHETKDIIAKKYFSVKNTSEDNSIIITDSNQRKVIIIAGKQIITENNIEVLALGSITNFNYGNTIEKTIDQIYESGAIPILPWGVGKWLGKRKEILLRYIESNSVKRFFLGDNGGRPIFWSRPKLFNKGAESNHFVLPGSDALAIPSEFNKTGSYGFFMEAEIDKNKPAESLIKSILNLDKQPSTFGKQESPIKFFINQIKMQLRKHIK